jgi:hypothetical protein
LKCEHDYEYLKNLANRTINLTQSRALALAELKERIKIKQNEEEILKNESRARQRALQDQVLCGVFMLDVCFALSAL